MRDQRAELEDALVSQTRDWAGERDRAQRFGELIVDRRGDAAQARRSMASEASIRI